MEVEITKRQLLPSSLLAAAGGEISGRTRMQKLVFLLDEAALGETYDAYDLTGNPRYSHEIRHEASRILDTSSTTDFRRRHSTGHSHYPD